MTDNMKKLMEKVSADEALRTKLDELRKQAAGDVEKAKELLKAFAAGQGVPLADEDFEADEGALSDEALEGISGGSDYGDVSISDLIREFSREFSRKYFCPACGGEVDGSSSRCPHCGFCTGFITFRQRENL